MFVTLTVESIVEGAETILPPVITVCLIVALILRELIVGLESVRLERLRQVLTIAIVPMLIIFVTTVAVKIADSIGAQ